MNGSNRNGEAALYYLYMMADGEVTSGEKKLFNKICKELDIDTDEKNIVIKKCKDLVTGKADVLSIILEEEIVEQAGQRWGRLRDESSLARIIWNLVNLGYADTYYSDEEKTIVSYLVDKWSVSSEVYQELVDTADTMLALTKKKEWIVSTFSKDSMRNKKEKQVNSEIKQLLDDVKLTIQELTM